MERDWREASAEGGANMEELVLDCSAGARKGALVDALLELLDEEQRGAFLREFNGLGLGNVSAELDGEGRFAVLSGGLTEAEACHGHAGRHGESASHGHGEPGAHGHHSHRSLADVRAIVEASGAPDAAVADAMGVYGILAQAEAKAHDAAPEAVHFHEVGNDFAIGSILAFCMLMGRLTPRRVTATPIATGFGFVDCAHGRLPIPAPATANILEGMPHFAGDVEGELCTPTGAALVRHFADGFAEGTGRSGQPGHGRA